MVELVGERGYAAVKVRDVVRLAGVSTRSFYENFKGKEDCFLRTHELIVRGAARRIDAAQSEELDWRERPRLVLDAFVHEVARAPHAARLVLVDAYEAGIDALEQAWRAESKFEELIGESISRGAEGVAVPSLVAEGIVAGVARVTRFRLLAGQEEDFKGLGDELAEWSLSLLDRAAADLPILDRQSISVGNDVIPSQVQPDGDRTSILAATAELAEADGYPYLTVSRIRARADVSRSAFKARFADVDDCFLATLELRADEAIAQATSAQASGQSWAGGIYRAIASLCARFGSDPLLVGLCLDDDFTPGSGGSAWRRNIVDVVARLIDVGVPPEHRHGRLAGEASKNAIWELFHHDIVRSPRPEGPQIAATLSYIALAPVIGAADAVAAIRAEQEAFAPRKLKAEARSGTN
jgi:AcrR family transcriptional regulator